MSRRVTKVGAMIAVVVLLMGSSVSASPEEWRRGSAPVDSVDAIARTLTLDGEVYRVTESSRIHRVSGASVELSELRGALRPGVRIVPTSEVDFVRYSAIKKREGWEMVEVVVLEGAVE